MVDVVNNSGMALTVVSLVMGGVVWLIRLEGRVNSHDREHRIHRERVEELRDAHSRQHTELRSDIAYIRARIDNALNGKH